MRSRPVIQEKAVIAQFTKHPPIGEALRADNPASKPMDEKTRALTVSRLENTISHLMNRASQTYKANCKQSHSEEIDPNYITRLSTNEFFFYTREPLTLEEFAKLQNKIAEEAKKHPSGVHLILGSFAVKTDDDRVMNVVPYITCGQPPQFQFIVKNHTSLTDPRYNIPDGKGNTTLLKMLDKISYDPAKLLPGIKIDGVQHDFTFNNIVSCMTPGGTPFLTAVDICLDHTHGVAKNNFARLSDIENIPISQVVIANTAKLDQAHCIVKHPMHVDPEYSPIQCKQDTVQKTTSSFEQLEFGQDSIAFYDLDKYPLSTLQEELASANIVNPPDKMHALTEMAQTDIRGLLTRFTTEHTKLQQQYDALEALKEQPPRTSTLMRIIHNTLRSSSTIITDLQNYLDNPESQSPAASLREVHRILTHIIPHIKEQITQVQQTLLHKNLKNVDSYYSQNQLFSFFKSNYSKAAILDEFKDILMKIDTVQDLQAFETSLTNANHQNGAKYKILAQPQLVSFNETDSVKALNQMIQERKEVVSQADSLNL